jgi:hypothetical protein
MNHRIDWPKVLGEIAYMLGEPVPDGRQRLPCSEVALAAVLEVPRSTLKGWIDGSEPKHSDGERILWRWCVLSGKPRSFAPTERASLSAAKVR